MLDTLAPEPLVIAAILPIHLPIPFSFVADEIPLIHIPRLPKELALAMLCIVQIGSDVLVAERAFPDTSAVSLPILKLSLEIGFVRPCVVPLAVWLPIQVESFVNISILEVLYPLPMLQKLLESPFVL